MIPLISTSYKLPVFSGFSFYQFSFDFFLVIEVSVYKLFSELKVEDIVEQISIIVFRFQSLFKISQISKHRTLLSYFTQILPPLKFLLQHKLQGFLLIKSKVIVFLRRIALNLLFQEVCLVLGYFSFLQRVREDSFWDSPHVGFFVVVESVFFRVGGDYKEVEVVVYLFHLLLPGGILEVVFFLQETLVQEFGVQVFLFCLGYCRNFYSLPHSYPFKIKFGILISQLLQLPLVVGLIFLQEIFNYFYFVYEEAFQRVSSCFTLNKLLSLWTHSFTEQI